VAITIWAARVLLLVFLLAARLVLARGLAPYIQSGQPPRRFRTGVARSRDLGSPTCMRGPRIVVLVWLGFPDPVRGVFEGVRR